MNHLEKPPIRDYVARYCKPPPSVFLMHYGVKGMKWGVRRTPEELGHRSKKTVEKTNKAGIIKTTIYGHTNVPKKVNSKLDFRSCYDKRKNKHSFFLRARWIEGERHSSDKSRKSKTASDCSACS